jgi:hypothetical protein
MKTDFYTKAVLTVIAACLLTLSFRDAPVVGSAHAQNAAATTHVIIDGVRDALPVVNGRDASGAALPFYTYVYTPRRADNKPIPLYTTTIAP